MKGLDFSGLGQTLLNDARALLPQWLPGGKIVGKEYVCANLSGGSGNSLKINVQTGLWKDFATDDAGGDLVALYAAINKCSQKDAFNELSDVGFKASSTKTQTPLRGTKDVTDFIAPPKGTSLPFKRASYEAVYPYKNKDSILLFFVARKMVDNKKVFHPWSYSSSKGWLPKRWKKDLPLYNLDKIHKFPDKPILICEGEKAADAAEAFCGHKYNVTTWCGGASNWSLTDWAPLYGKSILVWPDADTAGRKAADEIINLLQPHTKETKLIDTTGFNAGKDAADFAFKDMSEFVAWAKPLARVIKKTPIIPDIIENPPMNDAPMPEYQPHTTINQNLVLGSDEDIPYSPNKSEVIIWQKLGLTCNASTKLPRNNASNVSKIIARDKFLKGKVWYDEFYMKIFTTVNWFGPKSHEARPWDEGDDAVLLEYIQEDIGIHNCSPDKVTAALRTIPKKVIRNAPREWMESLEWDGTLRVESFFNKYMEVGDTDFTRAVAKNFWISMVARIYKPGCKVDNMVILEGKQGAKKSTALEAIGGEWFAVNSQAIGSNDFKLVLRGRMLVALDELDAFGKADANKIKSELSTATDTFRAPYDARVADHPRSSVFVGTTNKKEYLQDETGNRRFWPLRVGDNLDIEGIKRDREQLFAEAVSLYKSGHNWYEVPESAAIEQDFRREADVWESVIEQYLNNKVFEGCKSITIPTIAVDCLGIDIGRADRMVSLRIGKVLRILGWEKDVTVRQDGRPTQSYIAPKRAQ